MNNLTLPLINEKTNKYYGSFINFFRSKPNTSKAYNAQNVDLSIYLHNNKTEDYHNNYGSDKLKSMIFGGLDGIITIFAIVSSCHAGHFEKIKVITIGVSSILAGAISMGHGDYFSEKAEMDYIKDQYNREKWEMTNYQEGVLNEMIELYVKKHNIDKLDATNILTTMLKYPTFFLDHMMVIELGLLPLEDDSNPLMNGLVTFTSFIVFGCIPLITYILSNNIYIASVISILTLGLLGLIKAKFTKSNMCISAGVTMLNGILSAGMAYLVSYLIMKYN